MRTSKTGHTYTYNGSLLASDVTSSYALYFRYDQNGSPIGFAYKTGSTTTEYYYLKNLQGDITGIVDTSGNRVATYTYDAWGNPLSAPTSGVGYYNPLRYRGYQFDTESGLYYLQSRYYSPAIGRFISADAYAVTYDSAIGANMFAYCGNNPVMGIDPEGDFVGTIFDIVSLASSVASVMANPADPWAWAGLAGDVVDVLLPGISGVGESTRAARTVVRVITNSDDVIDTARTFRNTANAVDDVKKSTGVYVALYKSANGETVNYVGKGGFKRAITSASEHMASDNELKAIIWAPAPTERTAFIAEYLLQNIYGVRNSHTYNKIWSPGRNK